MAEINVLCIATEKKDDYIDDYIEYIKTPLGKQSNETVTWNFYDVNRLKKEMQQKQSKEMAKKSKKKKDKQEVSETLADKLKEKMDTVKNVIVICSPTLKTYFDKGDVDGSDSLKKDEREALLKGLVKNKNKLIVVYLNKEFSKHLPSVLQGAKVLDGVNNMSDILIKIVAD